MSNDTRRGNLSEEMMLLDQYPLIPLDEVDQWNKETWLYVLKVKEKVTFARSTTYDATATLNSTINIKETPQWMENIDPGDILLQEVIPTDSIPENEQTKIIDTRTFTRPRKNRTSPLRPVAVEIDNLNSTFNFKSAANGCDVLNATVVIEDAANTQMDATFPVDMIPEEETSPCNNNVYNLNSTFPTQLNRSQPVKQALNATYSEEEPVRVSRVARNSSLEDVDENDDMVDEDMFRKPLMSGAVPKKPLIRTSTLNDTINSPKKQISPPMANGLRDFEKLAKLQEESLAQTSTPMGQRRLSAFRRPTEVDHNLGSPISTLPETTVNYGPPIPLREPLSGDLDNSNNVVRGQLTFEKSQNSLENQSNSPTSPAGSPYSSQSLESDTAGPPTAKELIRRSMPNLNNQPRLRLPQQPSLLANNLNRQQHASSESGLRPPSSIRQPVSSMLARPQFKVPQPPAEDSMKPSQPLQQRGLMPPSRNSLLPSKLKPPQLVAPLRVNLPTKTVIPAPLKAPPPPVAEELNATVVVEKPPVQSGIPRPAMSRIPMPRTIKSSIPTPAVRARAPPGQ